MYCPRCDHLNLPGADQCGRCLFDLASVDRPTPQDRMDESLMRDPVRVLMPRPAVTIPLHASLGEALAKMVDRGVGAVLVIDSQQLAGIITERDFLMKIAGQPGFEHLPVSSFMTPDPESVGPNDPLAVALQKMSLGGYRHMPVIENGLPTGVFSVRDLLRHVTRLCTP